MIWPCTPVKYAYLGVPCDLGLELHKIMLEDMQNNDGLLWLWVRTTWLESFFL